MALRKPSGGWRGVEIKLKCINRANENKEKVLVIDEIGWLFNRKEIKRVGGSNRLSHFSFEGDSENPLKALRAVDIRLDLSKSIYLEAEKLILITRKLSRSRD